MQRGKVLLCELPLRKDGAASERKPAERSKGPQKRARKALVGAPASLGAVLPWPPGFLLSHVQASFRQSRGPDGRPRTHQTLPPKGERRCTPSPESWKAPPEPSLQRIRRRESG